MMWNNFLNANFIAVYNLYIFFGEVSINVFCLSLNQVICFLIVELLFN